ncbi:galactokinase [Kwoniella heveanensis BCC8398]|uniref:Galactokinase n=1 Tax=Kwoniella heveanensis BCC8398 TaxID=1296120 RepID=A0A1B9H037_9TREE|nr:galactokinase [Kwoniella heveanensis BCC8398]
MAAEAPVPTWTKLSDIYSSISAIRRETTRWSDLISSFDSTYGSKPTYVIRAPGRVNVLGEHIDYSLFPVLPAAIEQDILLALRPVSIPVSSHSSTSQRQGIQSESKAVVRISNVEGRYHSSEFTFSHDPLKKTISDNGWDVEQDKAKGWDRYVRFAILECLAELFPDGPTSFHAPNGMEIMVSGTVPAGSGLSSSAAMVVGSVLTFLVANGLEKGKTKAEVVSLAIAAEHRMGLRTGGMDQSASALCLPYTLLHLDFYPTLTPTPLPIPSSLAIVITNSLAPHSLTDSAPEHYNLRVVEVLCATRILAHAWGLSTQIGRKRVWLREVLEVAADKWALDVQAEGRVHSNGTVNGILGREGGWSRHDMIEASAMSKAEFEETYLHFLEIRAERFHLYERILHTLTESLRVHSFARICREISAKDAFISSATPPRMKTAQLQCQLGKLLNQSHECMRDVYECTHPWVDELQQLSLAAGAIGSRMTGGGWGGSVISLLPQSNVPSFLEQIRTTYSPYRGLSDQEFQEAAFATLPGQGAGVYIIGAQAQVDSNAI